MNMVANRAAPAPQGRLPPGPDGGVGVVFSARNQRGRSSHGSTSADSGSYPGLFFNSVSVMFNNVRIDGRPSKLNPSQRKEAVKRVRSAKRTAAEVARLFGVHPSTSCRIVAAAG